MTTDHWHHHRRSRSQRGAVARGCLVAVALASGLAVALGLQLAGPQVEERLAALVGPASTAVPAVRVAMPCPASMAPANPALHAPKAHAIAASYGVGVMPAI
jgi:hypothetical protein